MDLLNKSKKLIERIKGENKTNIEKSISQYKVFTDLCKLEADYAYKKAVSMEVKEAMDLFIPDEFVDLKQEPENKYDPRALAVYAYNVKIGYLYQSDRDEFYTLGDVERIYIRTYFWQEKPRFELNVVYRRK